LIETAVNSPKVTVPLINPAQEVEVVNKKTVKDTNIKQEDFVRNISEFMLVAYCLTMNL